MKKNKHFDTIILGAGIAGTTLASILAKNGFSVLLLEKGTHPRFAIGEAMLPESALWMWIVAERFGIPELKNLTQVETIQQYVSSGCGVKRLLGFVYHKQGEKQNPDEAHQLISPSSSLISESHLFRPDVDHYMLKVAINYGVEYHDLTEVQDIDFQEDGVQVRIKDGEEYSARFLVDGSGFRSLVAEKFNLRENPTRLRTNTRGIFTHVANLPGYDDCIPQEDLPGQSCKWQEGTLHHVFDGGWIWVIPFDNHSLSESSLCSVGLMLNGYKYPKKDIDPEQEFYSIIEQFPSIAKHLKDLKPVRKWVSTDRIQYSSTDAVGHRYALLSHSYGFIDPLYSRGFISTFETVHSLAGRLLEALKDDDFSVERFTHVEKLLATKIDHNDQILYNTFRSMSHFPLWNAMTQLWLAYLILSDVYLFRSCLKSIASSSSSPFIELDQEEPYPMAKAPFAETFQTVLDSYEVLLDKVDAGEIPVEEAANQMLSLLKQSDMLPQSVYPWGNPQARHVDFRAYPEPIKPLVSSGADDIPLALLKEFFDIKVPQPV
ncbi:MULTISPECIES: NAD(P)/FAD-dependent oxidoreductase [unclassified Nostoc]|uniref:NAD(P)/FAD-dependent oxidoreductase n=1 Tax=unclassified Nostoc TaxID=2593658 RepID=UPI002AD2061D|nr:MULTISPECIES: tryptophan 7-halogenase [unclassified Nostoc]MDZ8120617.1 tryptophan 7-halogenase [Nostoc sp. CmiVER01]MDZ8225137.1 tryptophan 7-halogenase [Nostoc sp. ChiVER01]